MLEDKKIIKLLKNLVKGFSKTIVKSPTIEPVIIPRADHNISRDLISENALKVLYRLHKSGYTAFLVGGCVRDILLNRRPKDYDIATNALPEEVHKLFRNCRLIGRRFRLAHILFGKEIIEVATFRTHHKPGSAHDGHSHEGMIIRDNVYGTIEDDAWRRDFTINALYYNIADFTIVDYTGGMLDIGERLLKIIGDPEQRFHEDPVRMLRAIRLMGKLDLAVSPPTEAAILKLYPLLEHVSAARIYQEILKIFHEGATLKTFKLLEHYQLLPQLFPLTAKAMRDPQTKMLLEKGLTATDERWHYGKSVSPAFLFAVFLWHPIADIAKVEQQSVPPHAAFEKAIRQVLQEQTAALAIPKTLQQAIRDIFFLQFRLTCRYGSIPKRLLDHPRFRAGYDLLQLRYSAGEPIEELATWWRQFSLANLEEREQLMKALAPKRQGRRKRRSRKKSHRTPAE